MKQLSSKEEFDTLLESGESFFFLKHSTTCPISAAGYHEYEKFTDDTGHPGYYLAVQHSRELSAYVAEKSGVRHESPQVIQFENGQAVWSASHYQIKKEALASR